MTAELGRTKLTVGGLLDLQIGDVLKLDSGIDEDLVVCIEREPKHLGRPGLIGRQVGIQITRTFE
jgi:flagellar motor switch protein FliM